MQYLRLTMTEMSFYRYFKTFHLTLICWLGFFIPSHAQFRNDTSFSSLLKPGIIPVSMITYGILAQNVFPFHQWNHDFQRTLSVGNYGSHAPLESYLQWTPAIAVYALDLGGLKARHGLADRTGIYVMTLLFQAFPVYLIKKSSGETRPNGQGKESFPSGHTANAFAAAEFLRLELGQHSVWISIAGYLCATTVAGLRIYHNRHWLGDVVAGAGIGILSADLAYFLYPALKKVVTGRRPVLDSRQN